MVMNMGNTLAKLTDADIHKMSNEDLLRCAWKALLKGDTDTRDRIVKILGARLEQQTKIQTQIAIEAAPYFTKH